MKFHTSIQDKLKWDEFHTPEFIKKQMQVKRIMQADLIKAIDTLAEVETANKKRINRFRESLNNYLTQDEKQSYQKGIEKYENLSEVANKVNEIYLMQLDIYTYGTYCMLAQDEWDWRAFARHIYTILHEHPKTVNKQLNDIIKILKTDTDLNYDLTKLVDAKKEFSSFISDNSAFAKQIRINVDAHFDGDFEERLGLIQDISYNNILELYYAYTSKMHAFLSELRPALANLRLSADYTYHRIFTL